MYATQGQALEKIHWFRSTLASDLPNSEGTVWTFIDWHWATLWSNLPDQYRHVTLRELEDLELKNAVQLIYIPLEEGIYEKQVSLREFVGVLLKASQDQGYLTACDANYTQYHRDYADKKKGAYNK